MTLAKIDKLFRKVKLSQLSLQFLPVRRNKIIVFYLLKSRGRGLDALTSNVDILGVPLHLKKSLLDNFSTLKGKLLMLEVAFTPNTLYQKLKDLYQLNLKQKNELSLVFIYCGGLVVNTFRLELLLSYLDRPLPVFNNENGFWFNFCNFLISTLFLFITKALQFFFILFYSAERAFFLIPSYYSNDREKN